MPKELRNPAAADRDNFWHGIFAGFPEAVAVERGGILKYANPTFARCFGYQHEGQLIGLHVRDLLSTSPRTGTPEVSDRREATAVRADGSRFPADHAVVPLRIGEDGWRVLLVQDLSERKRREQQYRDAQKMQVVGRLVGGIVHDFNNLLTAVMIYSGMLLSHVRPGTRQEHYAQEILRASERGAALAAQLLALARQQPAQPCELELGGWLLSKRELVQRLVGEKIQVTISCPPLRHPVIMDHAQMDQVLLNLVVNARDAMPEGGALSLEVSNQEVTPSFAETHLGLSPGRYVMLTVSDTGCGMDEATRAQLFEPFFTTKQPGKGTGLGLPTVFGIVAQSGGHIYVDSELKKGTKVSIFLPERAGDAGRPAPQPSDEPCLLLVEDEELVRSSLQETLEGAGYRVLSAESGARALRLAGENAGRLDALITDIVMPGMNGTEVAEKVLQLRPELPVIYMSGYTADAEFEEMRRQGARCLQKPFPSRVLVEAVQEATSA